MTETVEQKYLDALKRICELKQQAQQCAQRAKTEQGKIAGLQAHYRKVSGELDVTFDVLRSGDSPKIPWLLKQDAEKQEELFLQLLDRRVTEYRDAGMDVSDGLSSDVKFAQQRILYATQQLSG